MSEEGRRLPLEVFLGDFLMDRTRRQRQILLVVCAIGLTIAGTGLVPSKITTLGIEFCATDQRTMFVIIAAILVYFLVAFLIYAASDYFTWRTVYTLSVRESEQASIAGQQRTQKSLQTLEIDQRVQWLRTYAKHPLPKMTKPIVWVRVFFDLIFPPLLAIATIPILLTAEPPGHAPN